MTMQDPLADMLTRIRNAQAAKIAEVTIPASKTKRSILAVLKQEGYIDSFTENDDAKPSLNVKLKYYEGRPVIEEINRISRPGLRLYKGRKEIPLVRSGLGIVILSTNKGVMTDRAARAQGVGGELLCTVF